MSALLITACHTIDHCDSNPEQPFMMVKFYNIKDRSDKKVGFRFFSLKDGILRPHLFSADTLIVDGDTTIISDSTFIVLPMDPLDTMATFLFDTDTMDHEIRVRYAKEFSIFDPACDPSLIFTGIDTLSSTFDSTVVVGRITNRLLSTNIEVYF